MCLPRLPWGSTTSNVYVTKTVYHISSGNIVWIRRHGASERRLRQSGILSCGYRARIAATVRHSLLIASSFWVTSARRTAPTVRRGRRSWRPRCLPFVGTAESRQPYQELPICLQMSYWTRRNRLDNNHNLFVCKDIGKANYIIVEVYCIDLDVIDEINMRDSTAIQQQWSCNGTSPSIPQHAANTLMVQPTQRT